jgi:hypothetical protein
MLLRAFLPQGWMPAESGAHATIVICTMDGPRRIAVDGTPHHGEDYAHERTPCAFAAASPFAPPIAVAIPLSRSVHSFRVQFSARDVFHFQIARTPYAPRGPPVLV